jgi:redox-sensitive bicupin YhaK (pirin superfamily)
MDNKGDKMAITRKVLQISKSRPTLEGAGVHLKRAFGFGNSELYDPFLLLDDFRGDSPDRYLKGFPWHPHRGIETITYVLRGKVAHGDSLGNAGVIGAGDVQWMTAGSGILHQEMPEGDPEGKMWGFQLWANLPRSEKMTDPNYQGYTDTEIPRVQLESGGEVRVICGTLMGVHGPVKEVTIQPEYLDVTLPPHSEFIHATPADHTALAYVFEGKGNFGEPASTNVRLAGLLENTTLIVFDKGEQIHVTSEDEGVRFLFVTGKPLHEPVAWYGPIVMNTQEELRTAFQELQNDTFIKFK